MSTTPIRQTATADASGNQITLLTPLAAALLGLLPLLIFWSPILATNQETEAA